MVLSVQLTVRFKTPANCNAAMCIGLTRGLSISW